MPKPLEFVCVLSLVFSIGAWTEASAQDQPEQTFESLPKEVRAHALEIRQRIPIMRFSARTAPKVGISSVMELTPPAIGRLPSPRRQEGRSHSSPATFPKAFRLSLTI